MQPRLGRHNANPSLIGRLLEPLARVQAGPIRERLAGQDRREQEGTGGWEIKVGEREQRFVFPSWIILSILHQIWLDTELTQLATVVHGAVEWTQQ